MSGSHPRVGFICSGMWYRHQGLKIFLRYSNEQPELRLTYLDLFLVSLPPPFLLFPWFLQSFLKFFCWFLYVLNLWAPREAHMCLMSTFNSFSSFLFFSFHLLVLFCFLATPCGLWDLSSPTRDWTLATVHLLTIKLERNLFIHYCEKIRKKVDIDSCFSHPPSYFRESLFQFN